MSRLLTQLRSPVGLLLLSFLLLLVLVLVTSRLQVAAYWETHPLEWQQSLQLEAALKRKAEAQRMKDPASSAVIDKLLDQRGPKIEVVPTR